jgi:ElaB/YqjD/DUF883 family membrane-anchored ribosome-binding protein
MTTTTIRHTNRVHSPNHRKARHVAVAEEAEGLLERLSLSSITEEAKEIVSRLQENVQTLKESAAAAQEQIVEGFEATEKQIKRHPWAAVGATAGVGLLIGLLLGRRSSA